MKSEVERLRENTACERPEGPILVISVKADDAQGSLSRVKEVLQQISDAPTEKDAWPSDDEWAQRLPSWFTEPFEGRTVEEVLASENLWDYGSWLDAMRLRGWEWWSSSCDPDEGKWTAILLQQELVYSIEPLVYLAWQSGVSSVEVKEA